MGKRGRRQRKPKAMETPKESLSSPQSKGDSEMITRYFTVSPKPAPPPLAAVAAAAATPVTLNQDAKASGDGQNITGATGCTEFLPGILTPEGTPTKDNIPETGTPHSNSLTPSHAQINQSEASASHPEGASALVTENNMNEKEGTEGVQSADNSGTMLGNHSNNLASGESTDIKKSTSKGAARSLQAEMDSEVNTKKLKKGGKKSAQSKKSSRGNKSSKSRSTKETESLMKTLKDFFPVRRSSRKCKSLIEAEKKIELEEAILSNKEVGIEVQEIIGKGRGVLSTKSFRRGDFVVEYYGDLIDLDEAKTREQRYKADPTIGCYMYYFEHKNRNYCVDATMESGRFGRLLNHSRLGNCCTKLVEIAGKPHLILVAKKDITAGEELLYDYGDRNKESIQSHPWLVL